MATYNSVICSVCGKHVQDLCPGFACPACHSYVSWEDCVSGAFVRRTCEAARAFPYKFDEDS